MAEAGRVLVAGVGYSFLRDLSVGPVLVPKLRELDWPEDVEIQDLSFGPIAVTHNFEDRPGYYRRVVLFGSVSRGGAPGEVRSYSWNRVLPHPDEIQARVGEAVTGVISLENLLVVGGHFGIWPAEVVVVEVEPRDEDWGSDFSPAVEAAIPRLIDLLREAALGVFSYG